MSNRGFGDDCKYTETLEYMPKLPYCL